jgi:conjugative transfer region protein, TIGR03748 family
MMKTSMKILFQCFALSLVAGCATQGGKAPNNELKTVAPAEIPAPEINETRYSLISEKFKPAAVVQTGRYSFVPAIPTLPQREPLQVLINVTIPNDLQTVGDTVHYLLRRSGYSVESPPILNPHAARLFLNPLPDVQRRLGPMTLHDALTVLVTPELVPIIDPIRRRINYVQTAETHKHNASFAAANGE